MKNFNWQIVGHEKNLKFLQKNIVNDKLAHAYLFAGPVHLGKNFVARQFMSAILCHDYHLKNKLPLAEIPCGQCVFCNQISKGIHPDVYYLKKEEDKKNISVEQVREMQKLLQMASFLNSYKIALIENADDLNESSQNALLKILEEPKRKTILILISTDPKLLLATLVSRCQLIKFLPLSDEKIFHHLISLEASREQGRLFTALAHGQIGLAVDFYKKPELFKDYSDRINQFLELFQHNLTARFRIINDLLLDFKNNLEISDYLKEELDFWQLILRDVLLEKNNLSALMTNFSYKDKISRLAKKYSNSEIIGLLSEIKKINQFLNYNINPRLAVENLVLNFSAKGASASG